jgi:hypothetical protein
LSSPDTVVTSIAYLEESPSVCGSSKTTGMCR